MKANVWPPTSPPAPQDCTAESTTPGLPSWAWSMRPRPQRGPFPKMHPASQRTAPPAHLHVQLAMPQIPGLCRGPTADNQQPQCCREPSDTLSQPSACRLKLVAHCLLVPWSALLGNECKGMFPSVSLASSRALALLEGSPWPSSLTCELARHTHPPGHHPHLLGSSEIRNSGVRP